MFERRHVEELLRVNGVPLTAKDEEIKSVLISACWHEKDVETAMLVLRENTHNHQTHVDTLQKIFRSDDALRPETISALLGVDCNVETGSIETTPYYKTRTLPLIQGAQIAVFSIILSVSCVFSAMWLMRAGVFHITMLH